MDARALVTNDDEATKIPTLIHPNLCQVFSTIFQRSNQTKNRHTATRLIDRLAM